MNYPTCKQGEIKTNKDNPRTISKTNYKKLLKSIQDFDVMLQMRPVVVDETMTILGGNQRYRALCEAGVTDIPYQIFTKDIIKYAIKKYKERGIKKTEQDIIDEFVIKDNASFGDWDYDMLANQYHHHPLPDWGQEVPTLNEKAEIEEQEIEFSEYLEESHNYVVLLFDNDIDWLSAQTHFNLKSVYSKRQNGKPWSKGIGRVVNGAEYLKSLTDE